MSLANVAREEIPDGEDARNKQLFASIIQRAVMDWIQYQLTDRPERRVLFEEAHEWLFEEDEAIFDAFGVSFPAACLILDIELGWFRRELPKRSPELLALLAPEIDDGSGDVLDV